MEKQIIEIEVRVEREVAYKEESSWANYGCVPVDYDEYSREDVHFNTYGNMTCVGIVHRLDIGSIYKMKASIVKDPKWGYQYKIIKMAQDIPSSPEQVKEFIRMLVTPLQHQAIYAVYEGQDVIQHFKDNTFDFSKVYGFGEHTYSIVRGKVLTNVELLELFNEFPMLDYKILKRLQIKFPDAKLLAERLRENPYILTDVAGVGFKTADKIALEIGIEEESPFRIHACIRHVIREAEQNGDTYIKESKLISGSYELLKVKKVIIKGELEQVEDIVIIDERVALKGTFMTEVLLGLKLHELNLRGMLPGNELEFDVEDFISRMEDKYKIKLTDQQRGLFINIKKFGVNFLIGYAGTGKSQMQTLLINLLEELGLTYKLLAPTGKAAKVLSRYTKRDAYTIHKASGIGGGSGGNDDEFGGVQIDEDFIIVDESSMTGVWLAKTLLYKVANPNARILFIGDSFQIPSVDKGNFLYDCQESGVFPLTKLDIVFRQSEGGILDVVTKVRLGKKFIEDDFMGVKMFGENFCLISVEQDKVLDKFLQSYKKLIATYGVEGVMVVSPTKKGKLGTFAINNVIQEIVNPKIDELQAEIKVIKDGNEVFYRIGDMVMNTLNTYQVMSVNGDKVDIMNGDTGVIVDMDVKERSITIQFESVSVMFSSGEIDKLLHAWCLTKHKSQGSAAKAIISITDKAHTYQLNANLVYVGWTRAESFCVSIGQAKTLNAALKQYENLRRNTFLSEILKGEIDYTQYIKLDEEEDEEEI